ncbi:fatty acyl-CoA reductase 2-like [Neltuma alba]|uniref:fatty acyl-CoA reductase 2-like n=1 Tax=Neltuma alba TaxID=207710 RepID=UPI0010A53454|nr:fatty acyl-CoA reductase 2-like [Prosopis alba]
MAAGDDDVASAVPVDMVVNAAIAITAKHGNSGNTGLSVYQFGSSLVNLISYGDMVRHGYDHFKCNPLSDSKGNDISISRTKFFNNIDDFSSFISNEMAKKNGSMEPNATHLDPILYNRLQMLCKKQARDFIQMAKVYEPYTFFKAR